MKYLIQVILLLISVVTLAGCKDQRAPVRDSQVPQASALEPDAQPSVSLSKAVLKSMKENWMKTRTLEEVAVLELDDAGSWWIGDRKVTREEINTIPMIQKNNRKPLNVQLRFHEGHIKGGLNAIVDELKLSGAVHVRLVNLTKTQRPVSIGS